MIRCTINGQEAIPTLKNNIKITSENPLLKDKDSWTMEVIFPMSIEENARIFANCHRLEVSRRVAQYDDCAIIAGNQMVIRGVGIVVGVNQNEVKLQIKSGIQGIAYRSEFEKIYIDRLTYNTKFPSSSLCNYDNEAGDEYIYIDKFAQYQKDCQDRYIYACIYDTKNSRVMNEPEVRWEPGETPEGDAFYVVLKNRAQCPNVNYVLRTVFSRMGYRMKNSLADIVGELANAYVCNTRKGGLIPHALPHWTVKRFLDEMRKMYSIVFIFDEEKKTVEIIREDPLVRGIVEYECQDEFTTDYNEQGLSYVGASNVEYNLADCEYRYCSDDISEDALQHFERREYASWGDMQYAWEQMNEETKMTTIFECPYGTYYTQKWEDENEAVHFGLRKAKFQHITRIEGGDNAVALNIAPAAIGPVTVNLPATYPLGRGNLAPLVHRGEQTEEYEVQLYLPCIEGKEDGSDGEYQTVQAVVEGGGDISEDEDERMEVVFLGSGDKGVSLNLGGKIYYLNTRPERGYTFATSFTMVMCSTDPDANPDTSCNRSFALTKTAAAVFIGQLHQKEKVIENQEPTVIKFLTNERTDPTKIHQFRNKRYICEKIETVIDENGIREEKTGYFYEMI